MKKINKLFLGLASAGTVAAPIAAVVSCGTTGYDWSGVPGGTWQDVGNDAAKVNAGTYDDNRADVTYVTDGGSINDKSFNEGTLNGVKQFSYEKTLNYNVINTNPEKLTTSFNAAYSQVGSSAKNVVVAGFLHNNPGTAENPMNGDIKGFYAKNWETGSNAKNVVAIDVADTNNDHFYGITFKTEQSGFMAAVEAGYMLNKRFETEKSKEAIKVATFGGANYPTVTSYMIGFREGVKWFNENNDSLRKMEIVKAGSDFTGNFNVGGGRALAESLLNKGVRLIFGVAGPQTADISDAIKTKRLQGKAFAIGVDVDQSPIYGGTVILSAVKGLQAATNDMLKNIADNVTTKLKDYEYSIVDNPTNADATSMYVGAVANKAAYPVEAAEAEKHVTAAVAALPSINFPTNW